jgi:hypothetical protein
VGRLRGFATRLFAVLGVFTSNTPPAAWVYRHLTIEFSRLQLGKIRLQSAEGGPFQVPRPPLSPAHRPNHAGRHKRMNGQLS